MRYGFKIWPHCQSSPRQGLKKAFIRLAGLAIAEAAVTLNWACAGDALAQLNSKLRRLGEAVKLCFEIEIEGRLSGKKW